MQIFLKKSTLFIIYIFLIHLFFEKYDYLIDIPYSYINRGIGDDLMFHTISKVRKSDIIYLGDSVIRTIAKTDRIKSSIVEIINNNHKLNVLDISNPANNPIIFNEIINYFVKNKKPPSLIIIPINLRTFSPYEFKRHDRVRLRFINELRGIPLPFNIFSIEV